MEVCISMRKRGHARAWTRNKVVVDNVGVACSRTITGNVATTTAPVVDDLQEYMSKFNGYRSW